MWFKNTLHTKHKYLYPILLLLGLILVVVWYSSYIKINSPYGISDLYGYQYLGVIAWPEADCVNCIKQTYFWDSRDLTSCRLQKLTASVSWDKNTLTVEMISLTEMSATQREEEKGDRLFIFDASVHNLFERLCRSK